MSTNIQTDVAKAVYNTIDPSKDLKASAKGQTILITGAGRGIGQVIAKAFTQAGAAALIICALEDSELRETKSLVQSINPEIRVFYRSLDVRDTTAVEKFIEDASTWSNGRVDVLCNNAGISPPIEEVAEGDPLRWWQGIEVNLKGPYLFSRFVLPIMLERGGGHIIITASRAAVMTEPRMSSYQVSKLAVTRLAQLIHNEYNERGIKCVAIHPGGIVTRLLTDIEEKETEPWAKDIGKFIRPHLKEEISLPGNTCVFLASGKADFMSGRYVDTTIQVDQLLAERETILKRDLFKIGISGNWCKEGGYTMM